MADPYDIDLHSASAAETDSGNGSAVDTDSRGLRSAAQLLLTVTALTGTAAVTVQTSLDGATGWIPVASFNEIQVGTQRLYIDGCARYVRAAWELTGGIDKSVTFALTGASHVLYGRREDLDNEINGQALEPIEPSVIARCRIKASCDVEAALATGYPMPLTAWPESIGQREAAIAVYLVMRHRGFDPGNPPDELIVKAHDDAQKWLKDVGAGRMKPPGIVPVDNLGVHTSSGNARSPQRYPPKMSSNWGDF